MVWGFAHGETGTLTKALVAMLRSINAVVVMCIVITDIRLWLQY